MSATTTTGIRPILRFTATSAASRRRIHQTAVQSFPRLTRDRNPNRGVSPIRRQPQKEPLGAQKYGIPKPVLDESKRTKLSTDESHGLWGFFRDHKPLSTPEEDHKHGRAWTAEELRNKSWEDLHKLWWMCVRERNIIATQRLERERLKPGYGDFEAAQRDRAVRWTQRAIKHVLTERYYAWQEARQLAENDPEVNLSGDRPVYTPAGLIEEFDESKTAAEGKQLVPHVDEKGQETGR